MDRIEHIRFCQRNTKNDHTNIGEVHLSLMTFLIFLYESTTLRPGVAWHPAAKDHGKTLFLTTLRPGVALASGGKISRKNNISLTTLRPGVVLLYGGRRPTATGGSGGGAPQRMCLWELFTIVDRISKNFQQTI